MSSEPFNALGTVMRASHLFIAAFVGACGLAAATDAIAQPMGMPGRRAGMWQTTMSGMGGEGRGMTMSLCVDPAVEHSFTPGAGAYRRGPAAGGGEENCSEREAHRTASGWEFKSVCMRHGGVVTNSGRLTGDLQTHYHLEMVTSGEGGEKHMTMDSTWTGPCPAGGAGNTITLPDGRVITIPPH